MSYINLLTDRCAIHHLKTKDAEPPNFGVPPSDSQEDYYYSDEADHVNVKSYFVESSQTIAQQEPNQHIIEVFNVHFLKSTDIRMNDKVVWGGLEYTARKPKLIKNHHIEVTVFRSENL